ncbi:MAG: hypothetical protein CXX72_00120 [Methanobacteriota archaeon]|jgi:hypothetical protein|nr:MAG: hypothetical protein CXX72_00120 [Euryarchaeota archaeon]PXF24477.1 MAG: hypothetical protein CXX71_00135 [Euryarchaeota archaeon]
MTQVSASVLQELLAMDDYDRTLALDRIARKHSITAEEVLAQLKAHQSGGAAPVPDSPDIDAQLQAQTLPEGQSANYLQDAHRYRVRYDPSHDGTDRQAQIEQAIMCPSCGAPLGIPATRPIKVTCPNCSTESTFHS